MSHEIESTMHAAFSAREGAGWTALGRVIPDAIARDPAKLAEFIGATFKVIGKPLYYRDNAVSEAAPHGAVHKADGFMARIRDDNGALLGVTSETRYHTDNRQPADILAAFRDELAANRLEISHAAMLSGGARIAVCATMPEEFDITLGKSDRVKSYITLSTGYDAKHGTKRTEGGIRVVCANTLAYSIETAKRDGKLRTIRASTRIVDNRTLAQMVAGMAGVVEQQRRTYDALANMRMSNDAVAKYFADVLEINVADLDRKKPNGDPVVSAKARNLLNALANAYAHAPGAVTGNAWGALNAVTYYATHVKGVRDTSGSGENAARVAANMDGGAAADLKARALNLLLAGEYAMAA